MDLNYDNIKKIYPKSAKILSKWTDKSLATIALRDLYDFFDSQSIVVLIDDIFHWVIRYDLPTGTYGIEDILEWFETRREAEEAAFEQAFVILEKRLNYIDSNK